MPETLAYAIIRLFLKYATSFHEHLVELVCLVLTIVVRASVDGRGLTRASLSKTSVESRKSRRIDMSAVWGERQTYITKLILIRWRLPN